MEWKKTKWTLESTQPALSIELKLYETTNIIKFDYKDEGDTPTLQEPLHLCELHRLSMTGV